MAPRSAPILPTPLRHPTPDLQPLSLHGVYTRNIAKLERSAEEMSASGSDIGEEIRRLSRQNSVQSENYGDGDGDGDGERVRASVMERMGSSRSTRSSSYARTARWGGSSPAAYVASPVASTSGSWSRASLSRVASSKLARVSSPAQGGQTLDSPLRSGFGITDEDGDEQQHQTAEHSRDVSHSSFAKRYDEIAGQIEQSLEHIPPSPPKHTAQLHRDQTLHHLEVGNGGTAIPPDRPRSTDTYREAQVAFQDFDGVHFSPDTDEFVEVDEDGIEVRRVSRRSVSKSVSFETASLLPTPRARPTPQAPPPPEDGSMTYYPAPVPRTLNMPKRLSQLPAASVQAKTRSQMLNQLPPEARAGAPWLSQENVDVTADETGSMRSGQHRRGSGSSGAVPTGGFFNERMSSNPGNLPAQLRAEMFFEHQAVQHNVQVKSESAVATLDSILAASATAPVNAFMDHPFAGDVRKSVYSAEKKPNRKSNATITTEGSSPEQKKVKKRRSSIGALLKRVSSTDELANTLKKKNTSRTSLMTDFNEGGNKLRKRQSQMSLGDELERESQAVKTPASARTPADEIDEPNFRQSGLIAEAQNPSPRDGNDSRRVSRVPTVMSSGYRLDDDDQLQDQTSEGEEDDDVEVGEPMFVQPSTLLAELQVRKAQLKSRNRTAATSFPRGMHSTLLELDAVEEINKRKRQHQRIALAWEDPHQRALDKDLDEGDEDVPLGMLFPGKDGKNARRTGDGLDSEHPIGLMEKRAMEDSEPLSSRMRRLRGGSPTPGRGLSMLAGQQQQQGQALGEDGEGEEGGETLGERLRRMKTKDALDGAIADVAPKEGERPLSKFSDEVLTSFGGLDVEDKADVHASPGAQKNVGSSPQPEEEETLGQRRARLQREREASGEQSRNVSGGSTDPRPPLLRSSSSLANLLAANPIGQRASAKSHQPAQGSLLHANERLQAKQRNQLLSTNQRSSSYGLERPLVDSRQREVKLPHEGGLLSGQFHSSRAPAGGFDAGRFNNGMGGIQLQQTQSTPMMGNGNGYFASPTMAAGMGGGYASGYMSGGGMHEHEWLSADDATATTTSCEDDGLRAGAADDEPICTPKLRASVRSAGFRARTGDEWFHGQCFRAADDGRWDVCGVCAEHGRRDVYQ